VQRRWVLFVTLLLAGVLVAPPAAQATTAADQPPTPPPTQQTATSKVRGGSDCATVRQRLPELARAGQRVASCLEVSKPGQMGTMGLEPDPAPEILPEWCSSRPQNTYWFYRYEACHIWQIFYTLLEVPSGAVLGTANILLTERIYLEQKQRIWRNDVQMNMYRADNAALSGVSVDVDYFCDTIQWCRILSEVPPASGFVPLTLNSPLQGSWYLGMDPHPTNSNVYTHQGINVFFRHVLSATTDVVESYPSPLIRCDNQFTSINMPSGCVFYEHEPFFELSLSDPAVDESARHIQTAQNDLSEHWGAYYLQGLPLSRLTDQTKITRNGRVACAKFVLTGPTDSCDEYPFRSTYQGAWYYPDSFSVAHVNIDDNRTTGARLNAFYIENRMLDGDEFWVQINP
jgi:hypothetical protein